MRTWSAGLLAAILFSSVVTAWVPRRWPESIVEVGAFALALAWIVRLGIWRVRPRLHPLLAPVAWIVFWGAVQLAFHWTTAAWETERSLVSWGANLALLFVGLQTFDNVPVRGRFLRWLLWFGLALSVAAMLQSFTSHTRVFWLFPVPDPTFTMGPFVYHNHYAAFIEVLLPLALVSALEERGRRLWFAFAVAAMIASVILSASRSGFVIIVVETAVVITLWAFQNRAGWRSKFAALAGVLAITAALAIMTGSDALALRFNEQRAWFDRWQMTRSSVDMFRDHAWTGVGLGNWPVFFPMYARYDDGFFANQAHNDWVQMAAEGGVSCFGAFALIFAGTVRESRRKLWCSGLAFVFLHALVDYPFHKAQVAGLVFVMLSAALNEIGRLDVLPSRRPVV